MTVSETQSHSDFFLKLLVGQWAKDTFIESKHQIQWRLRSFNAKLLFLASPENSHTPDLWSNVTTKSFYAVIRYFRGTERWVMQQLSAGPQEARKEKQKGGIRPLMPSLYCLQSFQLQFFGYSHYFHFSWRTTCSSKARGSCLASFFFSIHLESHRIKQGAWKVRLFRFKFVTEN